MKNTTATSGLIAWASKRSTEDALIVKIFRDQGAVFHVKTTNPQSLMMLETNSNLFGRTLNPHNSNLTSGGSTGGEAALLAMRGSVIGIGTDIGGSIRVPSAFCGVYGFKPSIGRMPHLGLSGLHDGMQSIIGCVGPLARCIDDLSLFCKAALRESPWKYEPAVIEAPWNRQVRIPERLKIGMIWSDGVVHPHPPVTRVLKQIAQRLKQTQHEIFNWDTSSHGDIYHTTNRAYFLDGGDEYFDKLREGSEPPVELLEWLLESQTGQRCSIEESWRVSNASIATLINLIL
jgi:amidase